MMKWGPDECGGDHAELGGGIVLKVLAAGDGTCGRVLWQLTDTMGDLSVTGDADSLEQGRRRAEHCRGLVRLEGDKYVLRRGMTHKEAIELCEGVA